MVKDACSSGSYGQGCVLEIRNISDIVIVLRTCLLKLYVYDLTRGMAKSLLPSLTGQQLEGIWHTSIVIYGLEYYFGYGIIFELPGQTIHGVPIEIIDMGETEVPQEIFEEYIDELREYYVGEKYHLIDRNCNTFTNEVCEFLVGKSIPSYINDLPAEFFRTPFGQQLLPIIESMFGPSSQLGSNSSSSQLGSNSSSSQLGPNRQSDQSDPNRQLDSNGQLNSSGQLDSSDKLDSSDQLDPNRQL
ncbi:hypothetical protein Glove_99g295 [Diversispora epigaea]|uniref:PPPDE domain-containing protein n=1 Tax=Diversispora epigaea TaxID=1348612 RepID=A0A397JDK2_9GLOM|nr:hypothetical protein Glove_99g295 [Diversispora epigaea]